MPKSALMSVSIITFRYEALLEYEELTAGFFMAYFLYGRIKYGTYGYSKERLGNMAAHKSVMQLYLPFLLPKERVRSDIVVQRFEYLKARVEALVRRGVKISRYIQLNCLF